MYVFINAIGRMLGYIYDVWSTLLLVVWIVRCYGFVDRNQRRFDQFPSIYFVMLK